MAESTTHLIESGLTYLRSQLRRVERAVVVRVRGTLLVIRAVHNMDPDEAGIGTLMSTCFMKEVLQGRKGAIVLDASQDSRFRRLPPVAREEFRSALCVPVPGETGEIVGLLYADVRDAAAAFDYGDLSAAEKFCRKLGQQMEELKRRDAAAPPEEPMTADRRTFLRPAAALAVVLLGLLWAFVGALAMGSGKPQASASHRPAALPPRAPSPPEDVVRAFLRLSDRRLYFPAHQLLSRRLQESVPMPEFQERLVACAFEGTRRRDLGSLQVAAGTMGDERAEVLVHQGPDRWVWSLTYEDAAWKIDGMKGGPLETAPGKPG